MVKLKDRILAELPAVRRYALILAGDADRADDLVQDCLERALLRQRLWRRPGNLRAWLFTILRHIHANQLRALRRRPLTLPLMDDLGSVVDSQLDHVQAQQTLDALWRLSDEYRETLLLVAVEGLTYKEAGQILGIPVGTVMSRLSRAREQLRIVLDGDRANRVRSVE